MLRPALGLAAEERVEPGVGVREVLGRGVLDQLDPVAHAEHQRHRLGLERGLAAEQVGDRAARLAVVGGDGVGVEPRERPDRDRVLVEQLRVALDLLEHHQLADLDVAAARLVLGQRRPFGHGATVLDVAASSYVRYVSPYVRYVRTIERPTVTVSVGRRTLPRLRRWGITLTATVASTYALDAVATAAAWRSRRRICCAASTTARCSGSWRAPTSPGAPGCASTSRERALLEGTGTSTNVLSKAAYDLVRADERAHARRFAAVVGYVATELAKEVPYYAGAFAALLTDSMTANDAIIFLGGANLGAAAYEYGLGAPDARRPRRRYASFDNDWVPGEYLTDYYSEVEPDEVETIAFFVDAHA